MSIPRDTSSAPYRRHLFASSPNGTQHTGPATPDYPRFIEQGYDCGSGPTESQCGTTTARVKGPGMRWDNDNADAMLALSALDHSNLWNTYWTHQRAA